MFKTRKLKQFSKQSALVVCAVYHMQAAGAEPLKMGIPANINIPTQPLGSALKQFATQTGKNIIYDKTLVNGKISPPVQGNYAEMEALKRVLENSGLEAHEEENTIVIRTARPLAPKKAENFELDKVEVRAKRFYEVGPLPGLGLTKEEIPGNVQSISAKEIKEAHSLSLTDLMNRKLQSVTVNDYQGNPFQMDVQYRGFTAGPQIGTPQGLSVFFDGIRVNEPFGDVVNWDMIPMNALAGVDVFPGSNPIFGLGTLGGAFALKTKDGFNNEGADADVLTGSFGRKQLQLEGGWNNGKFALFGAGNFFMEDGWRENSPSKVNQFFGKASYRGEKFDVNLSTLIVGNDLVGNGLLPSEMYKQDRNGVYTSPDTTKNRLQQFQLSGSYFVNDNFTITAQTYRRNSKRKSLGADVYTEWGKSQVKRNLAEGEQFTCLFKSTTNPTDGSNPNLYGIPDYAILDVPDGDFSAFFSDPTLSAFASSSTLEDAFASLPASAINAEINDPNFLARALDNFKRQKNFQQTNIFTPGGEGYPEVPNGDQTSYSGTDPAYTFESTTNLTSYKLFDPFSALVVSYNSFYYYAPDTLEAGDPTPGDGVGVKRLIVFKPPINGDVCTGDIGDNLSVPGSAGAAQTVDGAAYNGTDPGYVDGTPTAVLTNNEINQITDGASVQFNWNFPKHKFMVGMSLDAPSATYKSGQMLGMLDANRNAYLAPDEIRDQYAAADTEISNNNFDGNQLTKSIYASETWSPIENLHFTGAVRYNETKGKNTVASRTYGTFVWDLAQYQAFPDYYNVCINGVCPTTGYKVPDASNLLNQAETEKFSYYSLNPSLGGTWQATPELNIYGNVAQGTRTPSVIELGCALDKTPYPLRDANNNITGYIPLSLKQNRSCSLPSTLSGDPYLPQVRATTWDFGLRGRWNGNVEWNLGVYRTDLKDDIYMVTFPGNRNFFDTIGKTRRQGLEAGLTASLDKFNLRLNYALSEATFEDSFSMSAHANSSSIENVWGNDDYGRAIQVKPGNRMPGVPLHNLNATLTYEVTPKWQVGMSAVAHSFSYLRGNENNKHQKGAIIYDTVEYSLTGQTGTLARQATNNPGTVPGYMLFNFQTSYKLSKEWTASLLINNLFDKEYFSAGRLGINPFSPSINGAIGPSGYNHNSNDWLATNFLAPGAPRGVWFSLNWHFQPD